MLFELNATSSSQAPQGQRLIIKSVKVWNFQHPTMLVYLFYKSAFCHVVLRSRPFGLRRLVGVLTHSPPPPPLPVVFASADLLQIGFPTV